MWALLEAMRWDKQDQQHDCELNNRCNVDTGCVCVQYIDQNTETAESKGFNYIDSYTSPSTWCCLISDCPSQQLLHLESTLLHNRAVNQKAVPLPFADNVITSSMHCKLKLNRRFPEGTLSTGLIYSYRWRIISSCYVDGRKSTLPG